MAAPLGCTRPGELVRWVMTTHPASVNAGSTAGERRVSAADDVPDGGGGGDDGDVSWRAHVLNMSA